MTKPQINRRETVAGAAVLGALTTLAATKGKAMAQNNETALSAAFDIDDLSRQNSEIDGPWFRFFNNNTMYTGIYEIPARREDQQSPHQHDELYIVTKGRAILTAGNDQFPAKAGSIFFVKATVPHKFIDIEEDLQVIVFFSKADPNGE